MPLKYAFLISASLLLLVLLLSGGAGQGVTVATAHGAKPGAPVDPRLADARASSAPRIIDTGAASTYPAATRLPVTPSSTASPQPSPTLRPSSTPSPTATPSRTPTGTSKASSASLPTTRPEATATPSPPPTSSPQPTPSPVATTALGEDIVHILLIGGDGTYVPDMNTDTLMVAVIDRATEQVSLLSIPRDLWVNIPGFGMGRINTAHRLGTRYKYSDGRGPGLLMQTIEDNLGIPIEHWVRIGYDGFASAVDQLGGVDMIVPCRVNLQYRPPASGTEQEMILEAGVHHLDGLTALRYVRTRRGETDFERERRQQQFLKEVWHQFKSASLIPKIPGLWSALKGSFATDLKLGDILDLAPVILDLKPQQVRSYYIGRGQVQSWTTPGGAAVLLPIPDKIAELLASLYAARPAGPLPPEPEPAHIEVQNGTNRRDLAEIAADQLRWRGFDALAAGIAGPTGIERTRLFVRQADEATVTRLARLLDVKPEDISTEQVSDTDASILVILGADYDPCR